MKRLTKRVFMATAMALACCGACRSPTAISGEPFDGTWTGTVGGDALTTGTARLVLTQDGPGVSGTYAFTFADPARNRSGSTAGTSVGTRLTITMAGEPLVCSATVTLSGTLTATLTAAAGRLTGTYSGFTCGGAVGGSLDLGRE
jgi:hypothetical protein